MYAWLGNDSPTLFTYGTVRRFGGLVLDPAIQGVFLPPFGEKMGDPLRKESFTTRGSIIFPPLWWQKDPPATILPRNLSASRSTAGNLSKAAQLSLVPGMTFCRSATTSVCIRSAYHGSSKADACTRVGGSRLKPCQGLQHCRRLIHVWQLAYQSRGVLGVFHVHKSETPATGSFPLACLQKASFQMASACGQVGSTLSFGRSPKG